ncbi:MAG: S8 family serine peptidase [Promethearchaeota archaeon]
MNKKLNIKEVKSMRLNISKSKKRIVLYTFLLIMIISGFTTAPQYNSFVSNLVNPNISTGITIITPADGEQYFDPMEGYYPAIYGFENDDDGTNPEGWVVFEDGGTAHVMSNLDGHKKIVYLEDTSSSSHVSIENDFTGQIDGTIEFWIRVSSTSEKCNTIELYDDNSEDGVLIKFDSGTIYYYTTSWHAILPYDANKWHHIKIEFNCSEPSNDWHIWIDDFHRGPYTFKGNPIAMDNFRINTQNGKTTDTWVDAIGYDWEHYDVGDNKEEGFLLSFTPNNFASMSYKLDGLSSISILGNITIPMPDYGVHTIEVFGGSSSGSSQFKISPIKIINPKAENVYANMETDTSGLYDYPGTYSFESDADGNNPNDWDVYEVAEVATVDVISNIYEDRHNKIVKLHDTTEDYAVKMYNDFSTRTYGTVELWIRSSDVSEFFEFSLKNGDILVAQNRICYSKIQTRDDGTWKDVVSVDADTWYYIRIDFRGSYGSEYKELEDQYTYKIKIYINGDIYGYGPYLFWNNYDVDRFFMRTGKEGLGYDCYVDAVGYSWDVEEDYNIGDNLNEGVLVSFTGEEELETMEYTLNDETFSILGDFVLPLDDYGKHTIQISGKDDQQTTLTSKERTFYIFPKEVLDWGVDAIDAEKVWGGSDKALKVLTGEDYYAGEGVNVLVIDSGVDINHPDLAANYKGGYDFLNNDTIPEDTLGHGTHCAGIIVGIESYFGVIGVAPRCNLYVARISDDSDTTDNTDEIIDAIQWAINTHNDADQNNDIHIISMSFACEETTTLNNNISQANQMGIITVAASGNYVGYNPDPPPPYDYVDRDVQYPGNNAYTISVGALRQEEQDFKRLVEYDFDDESGSCYDEDSLEKKLDLVAPGFRINSPCIVPIDGSIDDADGVENGYAKLKGTSMACPMVAGVIALILSARLKKELTWLSPAQIKECLTESATKVGGVTYVDGYHKEYGYGMVNAEAAVDYALTHFLE